MAKGLRQLLENLSKTIAKTAGAAIPPVAAVQKLQAPQVKQVAYRIKPAVRRLTSAAIPPLATFQEKVLERIPPFRTLTPQQAIEAQKIEREQWERRYARIPDVVKIPTQRILEAGGLGVPGMVFARIKPVQPITIPTVVKIPTQRILEAGGLGVPGMVFARMVTPAIREVLEKYPITISTRQIARGFLEGMRMPRPLDVAETHGVEPKRMMELIEPFGKAKPETAAERAAIKDYIRQQAQVAVAGEAPKIGKGIPAKVPNLADRVKEVKKIRAAAVKELDSFSAGIEGRNWKETYKFKQQFLSYLRDTDSVIGAEIDKLENIISDADDMLAKLVRNARGQLITKKGEIVKKVPVVTSKVREK